MEICKLKSFHLNIFPTIKSSFAFNFSTDDLTHIEQSCLVAAPRIKKLITELKQCVYIEASTQTGENVDLVFNTGNSGV